MILTSSAKWSLNMVNKEKAVGLSSFCIPKHAVLKFIESHTESKVICAYLIIAAHTDATGNLSTAGINAITGRLGCRRESAQSCVSKLVDLKLIELILNDKNELSAIPSDPRFKVLDFGEDIVDRVWIGKSLVDYINEQSDQPNNANSPIYTTTKWAPIRSLYNRESICVTLLLWLYSMYDPKWLAVKPSFHSNSCGAFVRYQNVSDTEHESDSHSIRIYGNPEPIFDQCLLSKHYKYKDITTALGVLIGLSFVYEVIMVCDMALTPEGDNPDETYIAEDAQPLYHLHSRSPRYPLSNDEIGLSHLTTEIAKLHDGFLDLICRKSGTFDNKFAVVSPPFFSEGVLGMYRLRHRIRNSKNRGVSEPWATLMASERNYRDWLHDISTEDYELDLTKLKQAHAFNLKTRKILKK